MDEIIVNIYVTFLNYNESSEDKRPPIKNDGFCFLNSNDLQKHRKYKRQQKNILDPDSYRHYKWYNSILKYELNCAPQGSKLRVNQFEIESNNFGAFHLNGDFFPTVTMIFGPEMKHWYYSVPGDVCHHMCGSKTMEKATGLFEPLDIIKMKQRQLRPEPNDAILGLISNAYAVEPSLIPIAQPPFYACRYGESLDCLDPVCKCNNLFKFETMLFKADELTNHLYFSSNGPTRRNSEPSTMVESRPVGKERSSSA